MQIINMTQASEAQIMQAAQILTDSLPHSWPTFGHWQGNRNSA